VIFSPILWHISEHIFGMSDIHEVVAVIGLTEEHIETQAAGRIDASLDQLDNVALAAP
jgi:hypothetical protein